MNVLLCGVSIVIPQCTIAHHYNTTQSYIANVVDSKVYEDIFRLKYFISLSLLLPYRLRRNEYINMDISKYVYS